MFIYSYIYIHIYAFSSICMYKSTMRILAFEAGNTVRVSLTRFSSLSHYVLYSPSYVFSLFLCTVLFRVDKDHQGRDTGSEKWFMMVEKRNDHQAKETASVPLFTVEVMVASSTWFQEQILCGHTLRSRSDSRLFLRKTQHVHCEQHYDRYRVFMQDTTNATHAFPFT